MRGFVRREMAEDRCAPLHRPTAEALEPRRLLARVPIGPELPVNTFTSGLQGDPAVAADADGDFVVAWGTGYQNQDGSAGGIYAQRYTADGAPAGGEFRVNTTTEGNQGGPSVAMDDAGNFVVTWSGERPNGPGSAIYAQRYSAAGAPVGGEFRVSTSSSVDQYIASVAMDADGDFVVAWDSQPQDGSNFGVYAQRYTAAGAPAGGEFRVNTTTAGSQSFPSVAMDDRGNFAVTWESAGQDGSGNGVYAQRYTADGTPVGGEFRVNTYTAGNQGVPSAAMDADGDLLIAWASDGQDGSSVGIYAQRYAADGAPAGGEFRVNTVTAGLQSRPRVAVHDSGNFLVAWHSVEGGSQYDVKLQQYTPGGTPDGGETRVNTFATGYQYTPSVAMDADGDFVVAWASALQDGSSYGVYAQRYAANHPPTTSGIAPVNVQQDAADTVIDLFAAFDDSTDADNRLTYALAGNTNPSLFAGTPISVTPAAGQLTLDYAPGRSGTAVLTVRATDQQGLFVETSFTVRVLPAGAPAVTGSQFLYASAPPQRLRFFFSQDVSQSLSAADLRVERLEPGGGPLAVPEPTYDAAANAAAFALGGSGVLPNGNYRATLAAAGVRNIADAPMATDHVLEFFVLAGDVNRDRAVNGTDFAILASNFGKSGRTYAQGDLNGDGSVNGSDFALLAGNFGRSVPPPGFAVATVPAGLAASAASATPAAPRPKKSGPAVVRRVPPPRPSPKLRRAPFRRAP